MNKQSFAKKEWLRRWWGSLSLTLLAVTLVVFYFIPLPYYIFLPGSAIKLQPLIQVSGGHKNEKGTFMLTTVEVVYADNVYTYLFGILQPHHQVYTSEQISGGVSNRQYNDIETYMMQSAQQDAVIAAMSFLPKPVHVPGYGVEVISLDSNSPARLILHPGDVVTKINAVSLAKNPAALYSVLTTAKVGQRVQLTYRRGLKLLSSTVQLIALPSLPGQKGHRVGIGFLPAIAQTVTADASVHFHTGEIEGPSAGLMFTLEIINQLYPHGDLTRGYNVAGTGTMSATGQVGQIGGAAHKVIDANAAGADIFFVPADLQKGDTNALHRLQEPKQLGTHMKVVPVRSLSQAIAYLLHLPPKRS